MKEHVQHLKDEEVNILLNDLLEQYGYDFTDYSFASVKRRLQRVYINDRFPSFAEFRYRVIKDSTYLTYLMEQITVNVTEMFRDPAFFLALRKQVLPVLATYPFIRIWHAGCSTGEEVYSMAILLKEMNLLHKSVIYATDINESVLEKARKGIFPLAYMQQYSQNYLQSGGQHDFSQYYAANYEYAKFSESLSEKIIFAAHNLVTDRSFNEFQLIVCRNVLIYFNKELQDKVLHLFSESLEQLGFMALGAKETLRFTTVAPLFKPLAQKEKIWRKIAT
ncbi:CheR family methyltransferase [Chitinophaga sancti]|uniref:MCP methyltransferase, CheR-type n=1 Tax=Chitinophaga sancti TaxID=1004 RepID=A0A1K1RXE7_9BACT|nr:protein-glutamate O-methyltransferase CheR [Chitinophaga sancti]WQD64065.1 protein-glutamate O-methyltransferase CheR [Chitinophaga sancti]WQG90311.1 protein-glutamate O-methyltransferase CheR [Chitinophaga sancti]SFW76824.1 MCP methyltransferase, CheR-type [Chitinophaga sancti]